MFLKLDKSGHLYHMLQKSMCDVPLVSENTGIVQQYRDSAEVVNSSLNYSCTVGH